MSRPDDEATQRLSADDLARLTGLRAGDVLAGRYRLREELGRGGMGVVFRARDTTLDRDVAVKVLPPERVDAENRERLLAEARAAASLNHPGIVAVYDAGEEGDRPFVVMELVEGPTLRDHMTDDVERALGIVGQVNVWLLVAAGVACAGIAIWWWRTRRPSMRHGKGARPKAGGG